MTRARRSHLSVAGLLRRQFLAGPGASVALALLVLAGAFLATAVPRAVAALHTTALAEQTAAVPARDVDLSTATLGRPDVGPSNGGTSLDDDVDAVWGHQEELLLDIHDGMAEPLRGIAAEPLVALTMGPVRAVVPGSGPGGPVYRVLPGFDPRLREHVELTSGEWPAAVSGTVPTAGSVGIALTEPVAERMAWRLGEERVIDVAGAPQTLRLVGTVAPVDPDDGFWTHVTTALEPEVIDNGLAPPEITGVAFIDPASWTAFREANLPSTMQAWFPLRTGLITADQSPELQVRLAEFSSTVHRLGSGERTFFIDEVGDVAFVSGLGDVLAEASVAAAASDAVLATIASGPIGVMIAVLVLGARVVFERRRTGLELAAARGASTAQLRTVLALEGAAIGVPAAIVGGVAGTLAIAADAGPAGWLLAAAFAATPAVLLVSAAPSLSPLRRARADLGAQGGARFRWIGELVLVLLAAASVVVLLRRGLETSSAATGVDPLLAAVPLLLALVACVVALRLYPIPLRSLVRRTALRPDLVPFLGSARALRDPSAGLVPVLAVVVGVSVAVFSAALLGTVRTGIDAAADARVGADVAISGVPLTLAQLDEFRTVPGVEAIAPVYSARAAQLSVDGRQQNTTLIVVDTAEMALVQTGRADATPLPSSLADPIGDDGVPVLLSGLVAAQARGAHDVELEGEQMRVDGVVEGTTAYSPRANWVLIDLANAEPFTDTLVPRTVLVRTEPGADPAAVARDLADIAGDGAAVVTPADLTRDLSERPTTRGLVVALLAAIVLASLLTALAIVLTLVVGRPARDRLMPLLSTLGLRRRGERALVAWEVGPVAAVAVVVGAALGAALPFIVLQGIDLTAFTGGDEQPLVAFDPWLMAAVLAGAVLVTAVAVGVASRIGGRVDAARAMRKEEEG